MAYNENIPQSTDNPSQSQSEILANFQEINTAFNLNHGDFNSGTQGEHTLLNLVQQSTPQSANANEGLLFAAAVSGASQLFYGRDGSAATQISATSPSTGGGSGTSYSWDFFTGLSLRFGQVNHTGTATSITFNTSFSSSAYVVFITPRGSAALVSGYNVQNLTVNGFQLASSGAAGGQSWYYLAIGR